MSKSKFNYFFMRTSLLWKDNLIKIKLPKGIKDIGDYLLSQGGFANER